MLEKITYEWYSVWVKNTEWKNYYSHINGYTLLDENTHTHEFRVAFLAVEPSRGGLPITNIEELRKIDLARRAKNWRPFVFDENVSP